MADFVRETIDIFHINRVDLCRGVCTVSSLSKYLNSERKMDRLLFVSVLQRMGYSADSFVTLLQAEEYRYLEWRQEIVLARMKGEWEKAQGLLEDERADCPACNEALQRQFLLMMRGLIRSGSRGKDGQSLAFYEQAIRITLPEFPLKLTDKLLLNVQEIALLLGWQSVQPDRKKAGEVLEFLEGYVCRHFRDEHDRVKIYPKVAAYYLPYLLEQGRNQSCMELAEKTIRMMRFSGFAPDMDIILHSYISAAEGLGMEERIFKERIWLCAHEELMRELGWRAGNIEAGLLLEDVWQEVELLDETISRNRRYLGYSQESLSEGVCTPETLSRIETAKRGTNTRTFQALARKMSIQEEFYYNEIQPDSITTLSIYWDAIQYSMNENDVEMCRALSRLEEQLDMTIPCNRQFVMDMRYSAESRQTEPPVAERRRRIRELLEITLQLPPEEKVSEWGENFWTYPFRTEEIFLLMILGDTYKASGEREEAKYIYEKLLLHYRKSRVRPEFHYRTVLSLAARLSGCTGMLKDYEGERDYSLEGIRLSLICGFRNVFPKFVNNLADGLENLGDREKALKFYRLAFYFSEMMQEPITGAIARRSYEKLLGEPVTWY